MAKFRISFGVKSEVLFKLTPITKNINHKKDYFEIEVDNCDRVKVIEIAEKEQVIITVCRADNDWSNSSDKIGKSFKRFR